MQSFNTSLNDSQALWLTEAQQLSELALSEFNRKKADDTWSEVDASGNSWKPTDDGSFMFLAKAAREHGYLPLIPLHSAQSWQGRQPNGTKIPKITKWQNLAMAPASNDDIRGWLLEDTNVGWGYVHDKQLLVFDLDSDDRERTTAMIHWLLGNIPGPHPMMRTSKIPKVQLYYRAGLGCHQNKTPEIFHSVGQTVLFAIHPDFKVPFSWRYGSPAVRDIDTLPICNGMHQLNFLRTWGGPSGNGDADARYGRGNGSIRALLAFAKEHRITLLDIDDLVAVIRLVPPGSRHNMAVSCVSYARHNMHASIDLIQATIGVQYWDILASDSTMGQRKRLKQWGDFNRLVGWAKDNVDEGE